MEAHATRRTLVKPSIPTPPHLQVFMLSSFDQIQAAHYVPVMLHYHSGGGVPEKIHRLEESLSETLTHFYHLAGRYGEAGDAINCNDQGVEFVEAKVNGKLDQHLLDGGAKYSEVLLALPSSSAVAPGNSLPLVAIQVNVFECGGLAVVVQINHLIGDMFSMCTFINVWATVCRQGTLHVVPPKFGLARLAPVDVKNLFQSSFVVEDELVIPMASKSLIGKRFSFRNEGLSRLRDKVTSSGKGTDCTRHPSKTELLTALACKVLVGIDRVKYGRSRPMVVVHAVNLRGRTELSVQDNVFGNFYLSLTSAPLTTNDDSDPELFHNLVQSVGDTLRNAIAECGKAKDCRELARMAETYEKQCYDMFAKGETNMVVFSSWRGFPLYGADYGWGRPTLVSTTKMMCGNGFLLMDAESGDGIDAWVTLEDDDMNFFERHPDILKYACQPPQVENRVAIM